MLKIIKIFGDVNKYFNTWMKVIHPCNNHVLAWQLCKFEWIQFIFPFLIFLVKYLPFLKTSLFVSKYEFLNKFSKIFTSIKKSYNVFPDLQTSMVWKRNFKNYSYTETKLYWTNFWIDRFFDVHNILYSDALMHKIGCPLNLRTNKN